MFLDCTSVGTALASLEPLLGVDPLRIKESLLRPELTPTNEFLSKGNIVDQILESFPSRSSSWPYAGIAWFHLTRTSDPRRFREGIHPVTRVINQIWAELEAACSNEQINLDWEQLRPWIEREAPGHDAYLYRLKQEKEMQGPFGMLLLESALHPNPGDNHYLRCPETIEDICKEVEARTGVGILSAYQRSTRPAAVKFIDQTPCRECADAAIFYVYGSLWELQYNCNWNVYFDAKGKSVPASMIQWAEYADNLQGI